MGQSKVIEFLRREYRSGNKEGFTRKEIEEKIGKRFNDRSLRIMVKYGEITRKCEPLGNGHGYRQFRYRYVPNGQFVIANIR
jgi:hypothetical protein